MNMDKPHITSEEFRDALRLFPSGVTIVTIQSGEQAHGLTVSAFASVSPDPPLVAVIIDHRHHAYQLLEEPGATFAVNILHQDQVNLSNRFAWIKDQDRFAEGTWGVAATGAPVLLDALAWLDCSIYTSHPAGTHSIYVGLVQASSVPRPEGPPLVYWNRGYRHLEVVKRPSDS
jgi:flavin reductase (DIM6/NTAB) family NADH-FMN oxidoreductase RutF